MMWYERTCTAFHRGKVLPMRCDDVIYLSHHRGTKTNECAALLTKYGITPSNVEELKVYFGGVVATPGGEVYSHSNLLAITLNNCTDNIKSLPYVCYVGRLRGNGYLCIVLCSTDKLSLHYKQLTEDLKGLGINCNRCDVVGFWNDSEPLVIRGVVEPYNGLYSFPKLSSRIKPTAPTKVNQVYMFDNIVLDENLLPTTPKIHKDNSSYMAMTLEDYNYISELRTINQRTDGELLRLIQSFNLVGIDRGRKVDLQPNNKTIWQIS